MRLDRWIIAALLLALLTVGIYYAASQIGLLIPLADGATIQCTLPTASGLRVGQAITLASQPASADVGNVREIVPTADGVLLTIALHADVPLPRDAVILLRPGSPPKPSTLELAGSGAARTVAAGQIVRVPSSLELGAPEGLVEPMPEWPLETP